MAVSRKLACSSHAGMSARVVAVNGVAKVSTNPVARIHRRLEVASDEHDLVLERVGGQAAPGFEAPGRTRT
jgi:hypothetical protein